MLLRGSPETAHHLSSAFPGTFEVELYQRHKPRWTHRLRLPGAADATDLANLLQQILVLRVPSQLDGAVALDFYNEPTEKVPAGLQYTPTAKLIRMIKYEQRRRAEVDEAGRKLSRSLADVVETHGWLRTAELIIPVPGQDQMVVSASVRLGHTVAKLCKIPHCTVLSRRERRSSAKQMTRDELADLVNEYTIPEDLTGRTVLVVDDVFHTGSTMNAVAAAARRAGAATVLGLAGARNWRC